MRGNSMRGFSVRGGRTMRIGVALLGGVLVAGVLPATAALAVDDVVGIGVARTGTDRGTFRVPAWTDAAGATVTAVSASLHAGAATVPATLVADGRTGFWTVEHPLRLAADGGTMPAPGRYTIDVTATDSAGHTVTRAGAGTLDFTLRPFFSTSTGAGLSFTPAPLDPAHRIPTVHGVLMGARPGDGSSEPLAGRTVTLTREKAGEDTIVRTLTTGSDGSFQADGFPAGVAYFHATAELDDDRAHGSAGTSAAPGVAPEQGYLTASADRARYQPGSTIVVSGHVRTGPGAGASGADGVRVRVSLSTSETSVVSMTDADGAFTARLAAVTGYQPVWQAFVEDDFYGYAAAGGSVAVPAESGLSGVRVTLRADGHVNARGTLASVFPSAGPYETQSTRLQYSANGRTGWKTVASATSTDIDVTGWGYVAGWYRLYHPISDELAAVASVPVFRARHVTRVVGNNAAPEPVRKGATVTVTGTLQQYSSGWRTMPRTAVQLFFLATGSRRYAYVARGRTDAHGRASLRGKASRDGTWLLQYFGDATRFDSNATADYVDVR